MGKLLADGPPRTEQSNVHIFEAAAARNVFFNPWQGCSYTQPYGMYCAVDDSAGMSLSWTEQMTCLDSVSSSIV